MLAGRGRPLAARPATFPIGTLSRMYPASPCASPPAFLSHPPSRPQLRFRTAFWFGFRRGARVWGPADEPHYKARPVQRLMGGAAWAGSEYDSHDAVLVSQGGPQSSQEGHSSKLADADAEAGTAGGWLGVRRLAGACI